MGFLLGAPGAEMTCGRFLGLYTEADERDLPLGASPLNHDVDFLIGGVGIRPGLTNVLTVNPGDTVPYIKSTRVIPPFAPPSDGFLWQDSTGIFSTVGNGAVIPEFVGDEPALFNSIGLSENIENTEYIALSNFGPEVLTAGGLATHSYDQPRTFTGQNTGRVSQCGPADDFFGAVGTGTMTGGLAAGTRYCIYMFLMADGSITPASQPSQFTTHGSEMGLIFTNVGIGPRNCAGRIIALTAANAGIGGPYFYIPNAVAGMGGPFGPTVINDNATTTLTAILTDAVITAGVNLSVVGGNILQMREIGEFIKCINYAGRMFYLGERVKVDNIPNMTFDGNGAFAATWGVSVPTPTLSVVRSLIYGIALSFQNPTAGTINPTPGSPTYFIYKQLGLDPFGVPQLQNGFDYSARMTVYTDALGVGATFAMTLSGGGLSHSATVQTGQLTQTPQEFILDFTLTPLLAEGCHLSIYPVNLPANATLFVDRIEIFPTATPYYSTQLSASYLLNNGVLGDPQSVDSVTGAIDASLFTTRPLRDAFVFPNNNSLYFGTDERLFQTTVAAGSEPSGWGITEVTGAGGVCGPLADDLGDAWVIYANRQGVYIFDGGTPQKISQEIQQLWNEVYFPSINRVWVKIDLYQQRVLVGVPMVTPNKWMPDAPANATPATPNVILCMSYLGLSTASDIAAAVGVHPSAFTGQLLARDQTRKWTAWTIASPCAAWVNQTAVAQQLFLGGTGTGKIYALDGSNQTDDGAAIPEKYTTFGFADEMQNQGLQLGSVRKQYSYLTATIEGAGGMILTTYPENLETPYADSQPAVALANPALGDLNLPLNETGNYCFLQFKTDGNPGSYFNLKRLDVGVMRDPSIPITGI